MKLSHQLARLFGNCNAIPYGSCCILFFDFLSTISGQTWFFSRTKDIVTLYNDISLANKFCNVCNDSSFQGARSIRRELAVTSSYSLNSLTSFLVPSSLSFFSQFLITPWSFLDAFTGLERLRYVASHQRACSYGRQSSAVTHEQIVDAEMTNGGALYLSCVSK